MSTCTINTHDAAHDPTDPIVGRYLGVIYKLLPRQSTFQSLAQHLTKTKIKHIKYMEFPRNMTSQHVDAFCTALHNAYTHPDFKNFDQTMTRWRATEIAVYVCPDHLLADYELVVAKITGPHQPEEGPNPDLRTVRLTFFRPIQRSNTNSKAGFTLSLMLYAWRNLQHWTRNGPITTLKLSGAGMTLPDLTILAACANAHVRWYRRQRDRTRRNGYWFAYTMIDGLRRIHEGGIKMSGKLSWDRIEPYFKEQLKGEQLIEDYKIQKQRFYDEIDRVVNNPDSPYVLQVQRESERRIAEYNRQAEEYERRREEYNRRAEESERKIKEYNRQAEESQQKIEESNRITEESERKIEEYNRIIEEHRRKIEEIKRRAPNSTTTPGPDDVLT
ncbi:hypothetical protein AMATHDRAFT_4846 [Amanita thiersii Skay4041]|uniref:Uncharacterized protein n=1 Tax=Amanita thiersii Skay4041 TaxID=703135 RepID=A0A2A9NJK2_9AGAR|nr:hypothetical protein AMATHDRAFT_4846 [Amanita thiersii Skay4041]